MSVGALNSATALSAGIILMLGVYCISGSDKNSQKQNKGTKPYTGGIRIAWDFSTLIQVYDGAVSYPRIIRLQNGDLLCAFESKGGVYITRSVDEGKSWNEARLVAPPEGEVISAVPELIQLDNGRIILAYNTRPGDNQNLDNRFGIKIRTSDDGGSSWSSQQNVFEGGYKWHRGVWEPALIQLKTGEIQLFFANEYPYPDSNDQEISMVRSPDNGATWTDPKTISYRSGHRDGMPVPLILKNNQGIAVAIEDNGIEADEFKPAIIWTSTEDNWQQGRAGAESGRRWRALTKKQQLAPAEYGGAPYLQQLPSGQTVLSFQSNEDRPGGWAKSTMVVAIGSEKAQNFSRKSKPFNVPTNRSAMWNSLFVKNDSTVTSVSATTAYSSSGRRELYIKDGYVIKELKAPKGVVSTDGKLDEKSWRKGTNYFIGSRSPAHATVSAAWDEEHLYIAYSVYDPSLSLSSDRSIGQSDGIAVMLATGLLSNNSIVSGTYKIYSTPSGKTKARKGDGGSWIDYDISVEAAGHISNTTGKNYRLELAIPWSDIGGRPEVRKGWGINFELINHNSLINSLSREAIAGNIEEKPSTWSKIQLVQSQFKLKTMDTTL